MTIQNNLSLEVYDLDVSLGEKQQYCKIIDGVSFNIQKGEVLCLVGESGSGKTLTGLAIMRMLGSGLHCDGKISFDGQDMLCLSEEAVQGIRGNRIAMIFQDPMMTLNPVLKIGTQVTEAIRAHRKVSRVEAWREAREALRLVGIPSPENRMKCYPHEFSGGMRQRVAIAIAFLHQPELIIADEPTTALDVTTQSQILEQVQHLSKQFGTAFLWVTHDLALAAGLADRIAVMYAGRIVETGECAEILETPRHPYTKGLLSSIPVGNSKGEKLAQISGSIPTLGTIPNGCRFRARCERASSQCESDPLTAGSKTHNYNCWHPLEAQS